MQMNQEYDRILTNLSFIFKQIRRNIVPFGRFLKPNIPKYKKALRVLSAQLSLGGQYLLCAPLKLLSKKNIMRSYLCQARVLVHLLPPNITAIQLS